MNGVDETRKHPEASYISVSSPATYEDVILFSSRSFLRLAAFRGALLVLLPQPQYTVGETHGLIVDRETHGH